MARDEKTQAAIEAYRRTVRNEAAGTSGAGAGDSNSQDDERLLAERPPHWQSKSQIGARREMSQKPGSQKPEPQKSAEPED